MKRHYATGRSSGSGVLTGVAAAAAAHHPSAAGSRTSEDGLSVRRSQSVGPSLRMSRTSEGFGGGYSPAQRSQSRAKRFPSSVTPTRRGSAGTDGDGDDGDHSYGEFEDGGDDDNSGVARRLAMEHVGGAGGGEGKHAYKGGGGLSSHPSNSSVAVSERLEWLSQPRKRPEPQCASPSYYNVAEAYDACYSKNRPKITFSKARWGRGAGAATAHAWGSEREPKLCMKNGMRTKTVHEKWHQANAGTPCF